MYKSDRFKLVINEDDQVLYYDDEVVVKGCDEIMILMLELGICDEDAPPTPLTMFDLTLEELNDLEKTLSIAILEDSKCMPEDIND